MFQKAQETSSPDAFSLPETALDGVRYARLPDPGGNWRLGSLSPHWRGELPLLGTNPGQDVLRGLAAKNIFLSSAERPRLALMCCGLGSAWPGMGRELYDNFPAAREAMDSLAAYADWDLLSIMDESDTERLNHSRIQIPYLFMLEYAQWSQLVSLGLKPDLICGHSLGELVALCLSGVYAPDAAWHLFEIRSAHMARLEKDSANESGMLAIAAEYDTILQALKEYPDLRISNRNTSRQYILGGPRAQLLDLRKNLRRKRVPAFMLGINLAFHNPSMRVLRDLSLRRLNGLDMRPPAIPMLSCVSAAPYPQNTEEICRHIADLDENTVDWPKSVNTIRQNYGIRYFLELGPQETLCGLVKEIYPGSRCFSASRKGHETQAMRQLCARLYSLGLLKEKNISRRAALKISLPPDRAESGKAAQPAPELKERSPEWETVMELLAAETGYAVKDLRPDLDLRYDLALRSSRFPYLVQEAERRFKRQIALENLLQISTVGDLVNFLSGSEPVAGEAKSSPDLLPVDRPSPFILPPLTACKLSSTAKNGLEPWRMNPDVPGLASRLSGTVALCVLDDELLPRIWRGMAPFPLKLLIPSSRLPECGELGKGGSGLFPLSISPQTEPGALLQALRSAGQTYGPLDGILYIPPAITSSAPSSLPDRTLKFLSVLPEIMAGSPQAWLCCLQRQRPATGAGRPSGTIPAATGKFFKELNSLFPEASLPIHAIFWEDSRLLPSLQNQNEAGDMLARELLFASPRELVWLDTALYPALRQSAPYCPSAPCMDTVQAAEPAGLEARLASFSGECQFSAFADPKLSSHGSFPIPPAMSPGRDSAPCLPIGYILKSLLGASRLACPWLTPFEMSDVLVDSFPLLPYGLTRECRVEAQGGQWLSREKKQARLCHASMSVHGLSPNGRRNQNWESVGSALCILGRSDSDMASYHKTPLPDLASPHLPDQLLKDFYKALQFGEEWRLLRNFAFQESSQEEGACAHYQAAIAEMPEYIAGSLEWEYDAFAYLMEAVYQALSLGLLLRNNAAPGLEDFSSGLKKWRCRRIGFVRFVDSLDKYRGELRLNFTRAWEDSRFTRFNGKIDSSSGKTILSFLHFEFKLGEVKDFS